MMLFSTAKLHAAGRSLTSKVAIVTGCAEELMSELVPERKAVMIKVKNLSAQLEMLMLIKGKSFLSMELNISYDEMDSALAQIATDLLDPKPNALKSEDLLASVEKLSERVHSNISWKESQDLKVGDERMTYEETPTKGANIDRQTSDSPTSRLTNKTPGREKP